MRFPRGITATTPQPVAAPVLEHKGLDSSALIFRWLLFDLFLFPCLILIFLVGVPGEWPAQQGPQQAARRGYRKANGPLALRGHLLCVAAVFSLRWRPSERRITGAYEQF